MKNIVDNLPTSLWSRVFECDWMNCSFRSLADLVVKIDCVSWSITWLTAPANPFELTSTKFWKRIKHPWTWGSDASTFNIRLRLWSIKSGFSVRKRAKNNIILINKQLEEHYSVFTFQHFIVLISIDISIKVKTLWEGHKILKKYSSYFDYSVASKQVGDFFKPLWFFQKTWTWHCTYIYTQN